MNEELPSSQKKALSNCGQLTDEELWLYWRPQIAFALRKHNDVLLAIGPALREAGSFLNGIENMRHADPRKQRRQCQRRLEEVMTMVESLSSELVMLSRWCNCDDLRALSSWCANIESAAREQE